MPKPIAIDQYTAATTHFSAAFAFYAGHGQEGSAIAQMTAGLLALSVQVARIELALMDCHDA